MNLSLGIVGLPNVGKSTLFNALTNKNIPAENYPFCTIDPNVGIVPVKDIRLEKIAEICKPEQTIPAVVEFYDIAGLVRGASRGEGLGNQFLGHIKEVSAIVHVVRGFENKDITHVEKSVDPQRDIEIINTELVLRDIVTVEAAYDRVARKAKAEKDMAAAAEHLQGLLAHLNENKLALDFPNSENESIKFERKQMHLITDKPVLYLVNVEPENAEKAVEKVKAAVGDKLVLAIDIKLESELLLMEMAEREEFMQSFGITETGLDKLAQEAYKLLELISYFTAGEKEARAWTIKKNSNAREASGAIHTDFMKSFIAADIVSHEDYIALGGWEACREKGKVRLEGRDYIVQDGDVIIFKIGRG